MVLLLKNSWLARQGLTFSCGEIARWKPECAGDYSILKCGFRVEGLRITQVAGQSPRQLSFPGQTWPSARDFSPTPHTEDYGAATPVRSRGMQDESTVREPLLRVRLEQLRTAEPPFRGLHRGQGRVIDMYVPGSPFGAVISSGTGVLSQHSQAELALSYFVAARLAGLFAVGFFVRASFFDWMACALTIVRISPGKRCSISVQREVLCISTPRRSPRINPASLSALKCCESVDFGIVFSLTVRAVMRALLRHDIHIDSHPVPGRTKRGEFPLP